MQSENTIRKNLNLDYEDCEYYWDEWKDDIVKTIRKYEKIYEQKNKDWGYCLESDFKKETDFLEEINIKIKKVANENGLIIYERI